MTPHIIQLERDILRCESWLEHCPDKTKIREEILQYTQTLKHNYHAISGKTWEERKILLDIPSYHLHQQIDRELNGRVIKGG